MFEYSKEQIFNSATDAFSGRSVFTKVGDNTLKVYRYGDFDVNFIKDKTIYKTTASDPVKEIAEVTIPTVTFGTGETSKELRFHLITQLSGSYNSEYANNASIFPFKPFDISITVTSTDTPTTIAKTFADLINEQSAYYGNLRFSVVANAAKITITANNEFQRFKTIEIQQLKNFEIAALGNYYPKNPVYEVIATGSVTTQGKEGFGTYWTMLKNVQIQTSLRTDIFAQDNDDSRIVSGAKYNQYVIRYRHPRDITGMGAVGQELVSVTEFVLWINQDIADTFEDIAREIGAVIDNVDVDVTSVTLSKYTVTITGTESDTVTVTTVPAGGTWMAKSLDTKVATTSFVKASSPGESSSVKITGVAPGSTSVVIETEDAQTATISVTVS